MASSESRNGAVNRRSFVRYASLAAAGNLAGLRPFGMLNALAQSGTASTGYKALVCVFLYGGNDANNMIVPFDTNGYASYNSVRGPLALAQSSLLTLPGLPNYALHPSIPEIQALINSGAASIVSNVGTLLQPLTRANYLAGGSANPKPGNLFSHPDQQEEWQNASADGMTPTGWAGRISDALGGSYNRGATIPMVTSVAGDTLFCNGKTTTPVAVSPGNLSGASCSENTANCQSRSAAAQAMVNFNSGISLIQADDAITGNAYKYAKTLADAVQSITPLKTTFPSANGLAAQLQQIAQIIQVRSALSVDRQIFFCGIGNFDTHSTQLQTQATLLGQISAAMGAFYNATKELGVDKQVTTFTMSDFARTYQPNSNNGSDHGWGSHHFVVGGAVKGGQMFGTYPTLALGGPDDSGSNGRWIPTTSSVQYASTLAQWFGVSTAQISSVFPTLAAFKTTDLGFMSA